MRLAFIHDEWNLRIAEQGKTLLNEPAPLISNREPVQHSIDLQHPGQPVGENTDL